MRAFFIAAALVLIALLTVFAKDAAVLTAEGCRLFFTAVFPALFPFFIAVNLLKRLVPRAGGQRGFLRFLGMVAVCCLSGAPSASLLLLDGIESRAERSRMSVLAAFINLSCPAFVCGSVAQMLGLRTATPIVPIIIGHYGSALLLSGVYYSVVIGRRCKKSIASAATPVLSPAAALPEAVSSSVNTMLKVGGTLVFFYMLSGFFLRIPIPGAIHPVLRSLLAGLIEMTGGIRLIAQAELPAHIRLPLISFLLSFGGISIMMQAFSAAKTDRTAYLAAKLVQAFVSAALTAAFVPLFGGGSSEVFAPGGDVLPRVLTAGGTALMTFLCSAAAALICIITARRTRA